MLLPDMRFAEVVEVADRICERVRSAAYEDARPVVLRPRLSVSIGAARLPEHGDHVDEVLMAADNAMFAAKDAGRDQVRGARFGAS